MIRKIGVAAVLSLASACVWAQGTIKIAILGPMAFVQGENHWAGAELARDEINKAGGINVGGKRFQIELIRADYDFSVGAACFPEVHLAAESAESDLRF